MAVRNDFTAGEVLAAADLNDTFAAKADLASPTFTGTPAGPTAADGTNTTQLATTAFVQSAGGLVLVASETFSAVSSVSINNCFTATYDNYAIIIESTGSGATAVLNMRLRVGGTDNSTSAYSFAYFRGNTTSTAAQALTQTSFGSLVRALGTGSGGMTQMVINDPFAAAATHFTATGTSTEGTVSNQLTSGIFSTSTSFDGFTLFPDTGTATGKVTVYSYKKGA